MKLDEAKGSWALVTGSSSGIGREFAIQLAAAGMNIVLVARREHLLDILASELSQKYHIRTLAVPVDLSHTNSPLKIKSRLESENIKVRLLINNAACQRLGCFEASSPAVYEEMVKVNAMAPVLLCHQFFGDLISFPTSAVVNVSSPAAYNPVPYMAVYGATKTFIFNFSQALYGEWKDKGVLVQTLIPGPTKTDLGIAAANYSPAFRDMTMESVDAVVKASLAHLAKNRPVVVIAKGILKQRLFATLFPAKIVINTIARMFRPPEKTEK